MGNRKTLRSNNPLLVTASALTRAIDPEKPSRITVIRLLGDALHALQESQIALDAVKSRAASYVSNRTIKPLSRARIEADSLIRSAHDQGARALFSATVSALLKLPCRAGPLRRRAVDLLRLAAAAAGPAVAMQAADRVRSHINGLRKLSWSESIGPDFQVVCAVQTLADISTCAVAGREVARESVIFLLSARVKQLCERGDLAYAIAIIITSFPAHAPPDDRLVDSVLDFCFSSAALKHGTAGFGNALLAALTLPLLVSRGPQLSDEMVNTCAKALRVSATSTERGMWLLALVRSSVTARRSTTYQVRKFANPDTTSKFPRSAATGGSKQFDTVSEDSDPSVWVSNEIFEQSLEQIAKITNLSEGRVDATVAVAAVLKMWSQALPDTIPIIVPRAMARLTAITTSVASASALVDAIWTGLLKHLKPSQSASVLENLLPALDDTGLPLAAVLHTCATLLAKHGRQALKETGLTRDFNHITTTLINKTTECLNSTVSTVRFGAVRLISALVDALPRICAQFLTAVLQNLRIADLALATKEPPPSLVQTAPRSGKNYQSFVEPELSSILGHAAALSALIETVTIDKCSVPLALVRQCSIDSFALLRRHHAEEDGNMLGTVASCVRRRVGWGLVAGLAMGKTSHLFKGEEMLELLSCWKSELRYFGGRTSNGVKQPTSLFDSAPVSIFTDISEQLGDAGFEERFAQSATRSAALFALYCALQHMPSPELEQCAGVLMGSVAARLVAILTSITYSVNPSAASVQTISFHVDNILVHDPVRKRNIIVMVKMLALECTHLLQCMTLTTPNGEAAELCYLVAIALGEEAQKVLGESKDGDSFVLHQPSSKVTDLNEMVLLNSRLSMYSISSRLMERNRRRKPKKRSRKRDRSTRAILNSDATSYENERAWLFGQKGIDRPCAEEVIVAAAKGVAAIVSLDLNTSGSLIESLSNAKVCSAFCSVVTLEISRRLSASDLAEMNRALAVLQVMTKKTLSLTTGCRRSVLHQGKAGRVYIPSSNGDVSCLRDDHIPGSSMKKVAEAGGWLSWARTFSDEGYLKVVPFHDFHTRALGMMYSTRTLAAEAHRELSVTGGPRLWIGLIRRVISLVKDNMESASASQSIVLSNSIATLGALLEVVPESDGRITENTNINSKFENSNTLDDISQEAIDIVAGTIEKGKSDVRVAASLALSSCSHRVASSCERLFAALLHAWAEDKGEFLSLGHFGRSASEAGVWDLAFNHVWCDMGLRLTKQNFKFFRHESQGIGSSSVSFATGAAAVLASCRMHWWPLSESCFSAVKELCTELLQWSGEGSQRSRAAAFHGMTALWAAKGNSARARRLTAMASKKDDPLSDTTARCNEAPLMEVEEFSLKDHSKLRSPVGPFLDEVLYEALAPIYDPDEACGLQSAACSAVLEMIRSAGPEKSCLNLSKLPESLFPAIENHVLEAEQLMEEITKSDSIRRPRYWFGLCRAVVLAGERLNHGNEKSNWDLSYKSKCYAVRLAGIVADESMSSCNCPLTKTLDSSGITHDCAFGFLRKIFDFGKELCRGSNFDYEACEEGCVLLQKAIRRVGNAVEENAFMKDLAVEFIEVWPSCHPLLQRLVSDDAPESVLSSVTSVLSEELVFSLRMQRKNILPDTDLVSGVLSFLDHTVGGDVRRLFTYSDQGEEVSTKAVLSLLSKQGRVLSSARIATTAWSSVLKSRFNGDVSLGAFLFSVCGDFVAGLSGDSMKSIAITGGSVSSSLMKESELREVMSSSIAPIALAAVSVNDLLEVDKGTLEESTGWANRRSPGIRIISSPTQRARMVLGLMVWLFCHEHADALSAFARLSFLAQSREALESQLLRLKELDVFTQEAFMGFAQRYSKEFLKLVESMDFSTEHNLQTLMFMFNLVLSAAKETLDDYFSVFRDGEITNMGRTYRVFENLVRGLQKLGSELELRSTVATILDFIMLSSFNSDKAMAALFSAAEVQCSFCSLVGVCLSTLQWDSDLIELCIRRAGELHDFGRQNDSDGHLTLAMLLAFSLNQASEKMINWTYLDFVSRSDDRENGNVFRVVLGCRGFEDSFCMSIRATDDAQNLEEVRAPLAVLHRAANRALSSEDFPLTVALRCATSAILVEGENPIAYTLNSLGMVIYTLLQSRLFVSLIDSVRTGRTSPYVKDNTSYLLRLLEKDDTTVSDLVVSMDNQERKRIAKWLSIREKSLANSISK